MDLKNIKPADPQEGNNNLGSLEVAPTTGAVSSPATSAAPLPPTRRKSKGSLLVSLALLFVVAGLVFSALKLAQRTHSNNSQANISETTPTTDSVAVQGENVVSPLQAVDSQTVTVNGNLVVTGRLQLSEEAISDLGDILGNKVTLSPTANGVRQVGNISISGTMIAGNFQGNGGGLSNLNATNITTGTLSNNRLDSTVTRLGQSIPLSAIQPTILSTVNNVANNGGNIDIVGAGDLIVTTDNINKQIVLTLNSSASGDITSVTAGTGLTGGGTSGDVTLDIDTGLVTVQGNTFNGASQLVQLNGSGALPALSGTNLTNLNANNLASGTVADGRLSTSVTLQGNAFNSANQLVKLNGSGELPVASGVNLTNLNANSIVAGTLSDTRLSGNVTLQGNTFNLPSKLVQLDSSGNLPALNGSALTTLNASNVASGTLSDARLSANVALLGASQTFSGAVTFSQPVVINNIQPSSTLTIGSTNQSLILQGDLTTKMTATNAGNTVTFGFSGTPTGNVNYNLDASTTPGTYTLCTTVGNCASSGGGVTTLGGTTNKLIRFTGSQSIGDSSITDTGSNLTFGATSLFKTGSDSATAFQVQNAAGSTDVFTVDTTNTRVAIGQGAASYTLDVNGDINSATALRVGGNLVCDSTGCLSGAGSGFYIQNSSTLQTDANLNIESASTSSPTASFKAKSGQTADILQAKDSGNTVVAKIDVNGNISTTGQFQVNGSQISSANLSNNANLAKLNSAQTFTGATVYQNTANSTGAFQIQNAAGSSNLFVADTSNTRIGIGTATPGYTLDVNGDMNISLGSSYRINGVAICGPTTTCAPSSGSNNYIQNSVAVQTAGNFNIQSVSAGSIVGVLQGTSSQTADILQARDSSSNVIAKITSTGAIYQGSNQVCDTSNNCGYATSSGSGNYIQNSTSQQTANFNIKSASGSSVAAVIQGASNQTADILQVNDGTVQGNTLFSVNKNGSTANLISNSNFENGISGWTAKGSTAISGTTADKYIGNASMSLTFAAAEDGAKFAYPLASSTTYTLTFYARASGSNLNNARCGRSDNGSTNTNATITIGTSSYGSGGWVRYGCTFTTGTTTSGSYVYFGRSTGSGTIYVDAVQLELGSAATLYTLGQININGMITSPVTIQGASDSATALQVVQNDGTSIFTVDNRDNDATLTLSSGYNSTLIVGGTTFASVPGSTMSVTSGGSGTIFYNSDNRAAGVFRGGSSQSEDILRVQGSASGNSDVFSVGQNNLNVISNPSFESNTTGWAANGSATLTQITADKYSGLGSLSVATTAAASDGAKFNYALAASTTYSFSVYARATTANFSTLQLGYSADTTTQTSCLTAQAVITTGWTRYTCSFTTGTVSGTAASRFVYVKQTDATARTFYIDAVQLEVASAATNYNLGNISLNGTITSPTVFQNQSNSTTAFQIQNAAGANVFAIDTINGTAKTNSIVAANGTSLSLGATSAQQQFTAGGIAQMGTVRVQDTTQSNELLNFSTTASVNSITLSSNFDANIGGVVALGSGTVARTQVDQYLGSGSLSNVTTATAGDGGKLAGTWIAGNIASSTTYTFSLYAKASGSNFSTFEIGYSNDGTTLTSCLTAQTVVTTGWQRYSCTFTTPSSGSSRFVYWRQTDATARTFYVDSMQFQSGSVATAYNNGSISFNTAISSPLALQNQSNSTTAFQIQNAAGTNVLVADTLNGRLAVGQTTANYTLDVAGDINSTTAIRVGNNTVCTSSGCTASSASAIQNGTSQQVANFNIKSAATGSVGAVIQGASGQTADLFQAKDGSGSTVASISNNGSLLLQNTANSASALEVRSTAGNSILTVSTGVPVSPTTASWSSTNSFTTAREAPVTVAYNGYLYVLGGRSGASSYQNDVQYAAVNGNGTTGAWSSTASFTTGRYYHAAAAFNGYMYVIGGATSTGLSDIQYAPINPDGTLGSWSALGSLATDRYGMTATIYNGYLYLVGGRTTSAWISSPNNVIYAQINANGTLGSWNTTTNFPGTRYQGSAIAYNGYMYLVGGDDNGTRVNTVQSAPINSNGTLGSWTNTNSFTTVRTAQQAFIANNSLYVYGGYSGAASLNDLQTATVNGNGTVSAFTAGPSFTTARFGFGGVAYNNYLYLLGGSNGTYLSGVQYLSIGTTYAGQMTLNGSQVTNGTALFQNTTNSTTAFQIQNAAGTGMLNFDTTTGGLAIYNNYGLGRAIRIQGNKLSNDSNTLQLEANGGNTVDVVNSGSSSSFPAFRVTGSNAAAIQGVIKGAASQSADIFQVQNSAGTSMLSVGATGSVLSKASTNSTSAFQIQNASGVSVLNINTISAGTWSSTSSFTTARSNFGYSTYNNYAYITGGVTGTAFSGVANDTQYAQINSNGSLGAWISSASFTTARASHKTFTNNGYIYVMGGRNSGGFLSDVQFAPLNGNGTIGSWSTTTSLPAAMSDFGVSVSGGYVYITAGIDGSSNRTSVYYAAINGDGTLGSWTAATSITNARNSHASFAYNGYLYVMGGFNGSSTYSDVQYASINGNGSLSAWASTSSLVAARWASAVSVYGNKVYLVGGSNGSTPVNSYMSATINPGGTLGTFSIATPTFTNSRWNANSFINNGYLFVVGGSGVSALTPAAPYYNDVQSINLANPLSTTSISGNLSTIGNSLFQAATDSTAAFQIQNATATSIFQVDTTNSRVGIGNASPGNLLSVGALTTTDSSGQLAVGTGAANKKGIIIQAVSGQTADLLQAQDSTGAVLAKIDSVGNLTVKSITLAGHIISGGGNPTIAAESGAGGSPTIGVSGTDTAGTITLTTGTSAVPDTDILTVTFASAYGAIPNVIFSAANGSAAGLSGVTGIYVTPTTTTFKFTVGSGGLADSTQYKWTYQVIQ